MRAHTWNVTVPVDAVTLWGFLADYQNGISLCAEDGTATLVSGSPGEVGAVYAVEVPWEGLKARFDVTLAEADKGRLLRWTSDTNGSRGEAVYSLEPIGADQTELTLEMRLELTGAFAPLEPFGWSLLTRLAERMLEGVGKHRFA